MDLNEYQTKAGETALYPDDQRIVYPVLGLAGEAGELANKLKKYLRKGKSLDELGPDERVALIDELGDALWYIASIAFDLGYSLGYVADFNLLKLRARMERGEIKDHK